MAYQINFTDSINKSPLTVEDNTVNDSTSLSFPGRNVTGYGQIIGENFLHVLENFANTDPPVNPVQGQLWFDTTSGVNQLKINVDGTVNGWQAAGGLKKGSSEPSLASSFPGDLWVNTDTQQLYLFTGSGWILVGPRFSSGAKTGAEPEFIIDTLNESQPVVVNYSGGERVAIISKTTFTPKSTITGFTTIKAGINLNSNYNTYWGTAEKASALLVGSSTVAASNFLRGDATSNTSFPINVRNSQGVAIGEDTQLSLGIDGTAGVIFHKTTGSNLDIRMNNNGSVRTVIRVDSNERVGINNINPQEDLDVTGNILLSGTLVNTGTTASTSSSTGSAVFAGGVGIGGDLNLAGDLAVDGTFVSGGDILPDVDLGANLGGPLQKFNRVFASRFDGDFYGTVFGTITGNASGSASKLASATTFSLAGDITSDGVEFDGQTGGTTKTFNTTLSETFIADKPQVTSIQENDSFIVSRGIEGLKKITKTDIWKAISRTPVGALMPYAGSSAPTGWLLCDGSEVLISSYPGLFDIVGYSFGDSSTLVGLGTFKLPDLRGRFALGLDNMNNGITVPSLADPTIQVQPGGGPANRVTDPEADILGTGAGDEERNITVANLPDHEHDLKGNDNNQYFAYRNVPGTPSDTDAIGGEGATTVARGQYLATSGGILGYTAQSALNVMNPYLSLNYIIYTGQDV